MEKKQAVDLKSASTSTNVLHYFRSFNYLFTLSALPQQAFDRALTADAVAALSEKIVIAKSSGKVGTGFDADNIDPIVKDLTKQSGAMYDDEGNRAPPALVNDYGGREIVAKFNKESSGRFNFYFENFEVENLLSFDKRTGFSKATKLSFDIIEPYSLAGLLEALQVGAVAAGHPTYKSAPYILKLEFVGYPDWNTIDNENPVLIDNSTRYFVIRFSEMKIQADHQGTKYSCKAIPVNEMAFGEPNKLKTSINIQGETVGKILQNLQDELNKTSKELNRVNYDTKSQVVGDKLLADEYFIFFPSVDPDTKEIKYDSTNSKIYDSKVSNLSQDNVPYAFIDPITHQNTVEDRLTKGIKKVVYSPTTPSAQFASGSNLHDCISAIIRDSEYGVDIFKNFNNRLDENDFVDYFNIFTEVVPKKVWDDNTGKPFYIYKFYVVPYKIHFTRIPGQENSTIDISKVQKTIFRTYDYLYTGKNKDVMSFNLTFNNLYFQNQPAREGNQSLDSSTGGLAKEVDVVVANPAVSVTDLTQGSGSNVNERRIDVGSLEVGYGGESTRELQANPYAVMVKNLHQAIIDNVGMYKLDIEILGDPFYLVQNGIGNLRVPPNLNAPGMTATGDTNFQTTDVHVEINFRNPTDINPATGLLEFSDITSFSGIYKVLRVSSKFSGGVFTQRLNMIRMPGQPTDTKIQTPKKAIEYTWYDG